MGNQKTRTIAHRGFSGYYPENTLLAFEKALETGCEGIEFDVHLTRDGVPVIIHDETLDRTTTGNGLVGSCTCGELRALNAPAEFQGMFENTPIPTLDEYFQLIRGCDILTNIELKTGVIWYDGIERAVLELVNRYGRKDSVLFSSFNHFSILECSRLDPELQLAFLEESRLINPEGYCAANGVTIYHPLYNNMTNDVLAQLKDADVQVNAWTVNKEVDMVDLARRGIDGLITNYPDRCIRALLENQAAP